MILVEFVLVAFVVLMAVLVALLEDIVGAIATFAVFSLGLGLVWILLAAPDVALAEAAVGGGILSVLYVLAVILTSRGVPDADPEEEGLFRSINLRALAVVVALAVPLLFAITGLPDVGDPTAPAVSETYPDGSLTPYGFYVGHTLEETGLSNAVAAVLVVFRGLDTLGEAVVVFTAAVGVLIVLEREVLT
ncbi:DUF4040 domain-containing protein [Halalkaliarchaeum sp. AArc-CO]|uniref:DUF4040 domain-containing protein n=1 Tax=Halalkaliarchaeum sp. AArc-CO TaxID=2866381 RepID=UPI0031F2E3CF